MRVTGWKTEFEGVQTIFARKVRHGQDVFVFRDKSGVPVWERPVYQARRNDRATRTALSTALEKIRVSDVKQRMHHARSA